MSIDQYRKILNTPQFEAVTYGDGPMLVLAGAGSGKTHVLTYRFAYLVGELGVPAQNILAITFTNKAAAEMKKRISALLGDVVNYYSWIGTFHACCGRILRRHAELLGYTPAFTIYADAESLETVRSALKRLDLDEKSYPAKMFRAQIEHFKERMVTPEQAAKEADDFTSRLTAKVYLQYQEILRATNCMDFDDMILNVIRLWEEHPEILEFYRALFRYVLVDEYQDTNRMQHRLIRLLTGRDGNLCVVGDDDQSIYSFRGAVVENILSFEAEHPGAKVVKLEQNYRSTGRILKVANDVISRNRTRTGKKLWTEASAGDEVICYNAADHNDEADFICGEIKRQVDSGFMTYSDFLVLYRINALSAGIERSLTRLRIPYKVYGGMKFYDRKEIKDLVAYLRLLGNPSDESSLRRIINVPRRGIGDTTVERLSLAARAEGVSMYEVLGHIDRRPELARAAEKLTEFYKLMEKLRALLPQYTSLTDYVSFLIELTGLAEEYRRENTPEGDAKVENIKEFLSVTRTFEDALEEEYDTADKIFYQFLESVSLNTESDGQNDPDADAESKVTLSTIHSAKGLEYPVVFVAGLEEGVFPSMQSLDAHSALDEERRLMYVAVTRAKQKLYLSCAAWRMLYGRSAQYPPSRFLRDIPAEDLTTKGYGTGRGTSYGFGGYGSGSSYGGSSYGFGGYGSGGARSYGSQTSVPVKRGYDIDIPPAVKRADNGYGARSGADSVRDSGAGTYGGNRFGRFISTPSSGTDYLTSVTEGQRVHHKKFGDGSVIKVTGEGADTVVEIMFDRAGMKRLMLTYAKLAAAEQSD
ncbi:MAG: UvrD-helicase domain-containing protein [Clostridia bacterium]|nr:UvrD-helicase domain-containing protein [Clostridia bacterium]